MTSLVDEQGRLLPAELCNIKTLECLTKDRPRSPSRHSPSRSGKKEHENARTPSPTLPTFVQELNQSKGRRLLMTSPTALRVDTSFVVSKQDKNSVNVSSNGQREPKEDIGVGSSSGNGLICSLDIDKKSKTLEMKSYKENGDASKLNKLPKKLVSAWSIEDVCDWLDYIQLNNFKESFISQDVTGKTLLNLNYETLDELKFSKSSQDREHFLAEVYKLQQENEEAANEEMDKEVQDTLRGVSVVGVMKPSYGNSISDVSTSESVASSSKTASNRPTPALEGLGDEKTTKELSKRGEKKRKSRGKRSAETTKHRQQNIYRKMTDGWHQMPIADDTIDTDDHLICRENFDFAPPQHNPSYATAYQQHFELTQEICGYTTITRFWNSLHQGNKNASLKDASPTTIYKNAFHNLMNSGPQGVIKVWTELFITDMQYVSLLVNYEATACDVVKMVLDKSNKQEDPECYRICEVNQDSKEYVLGKDESPLERERQWSDPDNCRFELRWRNERLIEWRNNSGSVAQDLSLENTDKVSSTQEKQAMPSPADGRSSSEEKETVFPSLSRESDPSNQSFAQTIFDYNVEVEYRTKENGCEERLLVTDGRQERDSERQSHTNDATACEVVDDEIPRKMEESKRGESSVKETEFLMVVTKRLESLSSGSSTDSDLYSSGNSDEEDNSPSNGPGDERPEAPDQVTVSDDELEYSQQLRKSSKNLSRKLKLESENPGHAAQHGIDRVGRELEGTVGVTDVSDDNTHTDNGDHNLDHDRTSRDTEMDSGYIGDHGGTVDETIEVGLLLRERSRSREDLREKSGDEHFPEVNSTAFLPEVNSSAVTVPEVTELLERLRILEDGNSLLVEDNRELKKSCRTFEGKSRLKERELEDLEEERNDLTNQVQELAADLHALRAENTELRRNLAEANTKLSDVDGWVTRDVFEDIRGQLSVSLEEVENKEEQVCELRKRMDELNEENKRIPVLEVEVERLNQQVKEDKGELEGMRRDIKDKLDQIRDLVAEGEKLRGLVEEGEKGKQDVEKKLEEAENEVSDAKVKHAEEKKEVQKRLSDREYEVLIMKEEKKELCVKLKSLESTIDGLRDELKKKDSDHEAVIEEMNQQNEIKDECLSVTVTNLEQLVTERDQRIKELKKKLNLAGAPESELQAKQHEYEQNKLYLKHLIALVREKDPALLDALNTTLSSRDSDDWC